MSKEIVLQIVPRAPGNRDGVGDYALQLALRLRELRGVETIFVSERPSAALRTGEGFEIQSPLRTVVKSSQAAVSILLHYVNYGYDKRGVPTWLPSVIRQLKQRAGGGLVTIFHEVYASGSWRQSAFWLRPLQKRVARALAEMSVLSIASNEIQRGQLRQLAPRAQITVHPVGSNFGEPDIASVALSERDPHCWAICGGNELVSRSLTSFFDAVPLIDGWCRPRQLRLIGGDDRNEIREMLGRLKDVQTSYYPQIDAKEVSDLLMKAAFGWIDYFVQAGVPTGAILKSTAFAALCAHGVIPVFPHPGEPIQNGDDPVPGPFYVTTSGQNLPAEPERAAIAGAIHSWYGRNASSLDLAQTVASALNLPQ